VSLRRRIAGAAALAVAAVAVTMGVIGYLSTRSHLVGEVQSELRARANPFLQPHPNGFRGGPGGPGGRGPAGRGMPAGFGRMPTVLHALTRDGMLHWIYVSNGDPSQPAIRFVPPNTNVEGLIVIDNVAYAATGSGCAAAPDTVVALDMASKELATFKPEAGAIAGSLGLAIGPDGTLYVATTAGEMVALDPKTLKVKDTYRADGPFTTSPLIFEFKGKAVVAAATKDGSLHLLDSAALGGADHQTPLFKSSGQAVVSLASWQDAAGTRWLLGPTTGAVVAWKVADRNGTPSLEPGWTSRDLASPLAPVIVNGVALTVSTGSAPVFYALDASTGKDLWSSGRKIASALRGGGLSVGNSQVYLGTDDGSLYVFGFPIEH